MNWMETFFGLDLDHGDGTFEIALISTAVIIAALVFVRRRGILEARGKLGEREP